MNEFGGLEEIVKIIYLAGLGELLIGAVLDNLKVEWRMGRRGELGERERNKNRRFVK